MSPETPLLLAARGLRVGYHGKALLPSLDFEVRVGEMWAIIGRNGSGKTTLLRTLLGLLPRVAGALERDVASCPIGYVPQRLELDLSVPMRCLDVVRGGLDLGWSFLDPRVPRRARLRIEQALRETETDAFVERPFATLSEGQKQRVLMARVLVTNPRLLVLDEPTSAMDAVAEEAAFELVARLQQARGLGVMVVAHHLAVLARRATHVVYLDADCGLVLAGPVGAVARHATFVEHYGQLFGPEASATTPHAAHCDVHDHHGPSAEHPR
jgi:zinc transport system ATP-binding protein